MQTEDLVRRHQFREGYDLIDYSPVGLPIIRMTLEAITMVRSSLPVMEEFILKAINIGIRSKQKISDFYGMESKIISHVVEELHRRGALIPKSVNEEELEYLLSEQGSSELQNLHEYRPQDELLVVDFDGLRRRLVSHRDMLETASDLRTAGAVQLRPYPALPPDVVDLSIPQVKKVVRHRGNEFGKDILHLKKIIKKRVYFQDAVGLVFRSRKSKKEIQIAFIVDEQINEELELKFAESDGPKKMGLISDIHESDIWNNIRGRLGSSIVNQIPPIDSMIPNVKSLADLSLQLASLQKNISSNYQSKEKTQELRRDHEAVRQKIVSVTAEMNRSGIRTAYPYEYREYLEAAITLAKKRLIISSDIISQSAGTTHFFRNIELLLNKGVKISIFLSDFPQNTKKPSRAFTDLAALAKKYKNLSLQKRGGEKVHYLIKDDDLGIMTSRPFLGSRGNASFKCSIGVLATKKDFVDTIVTSGKFESWLKYAPNA